MENVSVVTLFTLSGFNFTSTQAISLFLLTLLWYSLIVVGNVALIVVILVDKSLHEPMYFFLCNLCISQLYGTVGFYPKFLYDLLSSPVISYAGCMMQGFVIHSWLCADFSILALMAYDRYVAICQPLIYHSVMTTFRVSICVLASWLIPIFSMSMNTATLVGHSLCGSHINKIYCVNWMIAVLACSPTTANTAVGYVNMLFYFGLFVFVVWSYMYMIRTCILSKEHQAKFMQTCLPHLISLIIFVTAVLFDLMYMRFGSYSSPNFYNFMSLEFLFVPPLVNPLVYGFKLKKLRNKILDIYAVGGGKSTQP